jgi:hypothetical protein
VTDLFLFMLAVAAVVIVGLIVGIIVSRPLDRLAAGPPSADAAANGNGEVDPPADRAAGSPDPGDQHEEVP